ncbi:substrate-binding periplasmic protein [Aestuariispira insulae]|uniref:Amino acid ABC transporter substrate-binding protein (PAAT family) n=1 Tax=Aestuariispira insulae TaxID=1461337 RepID=A0A3D9HGI5_9PROT|nr:transporter substrate-binding domain-containing protein [Aestuariispira insulae]RED48612.1 amino acid ABC transporter substrate-binding protein (PAAT family) [Aestuariispira insulae]
MRFFCFIPLTILSLLTTARAETVRFCVGDWPPYTTVADDMVSGITVDIYREALKSIGHEAAFMHVRWKRCLLHVQKGDFHAAADSGPREGFLQGPTFTAIFAQNIWVHNDHPAQSYPGPSLMKNRRLGLVSAYVYPDEIEKDPAIILDYAETDETNLRKLALKRIDMALSDLVNSRIFVRKHNLPIRPLAPVVSINRLYPSFGPDHHDLQENMDKALRQMVDNGRLDLIYQAYLGISFTQLQKLASSNSP